MLTLKSFISQSNIDASLIRAVVRQMGGWEEFTDRAADVTNHGADGGFGGFIYYSETCAFYAKHRALILELVKNMADSLGEGVLEMVQNFNCLGKDFSLDEIGETLYGNKNKHQTQVANALAWFALEEVSRAYDDLANN